jgi:hypothetical protein
LNLKSIGTARRLRDILISAPWSVYDLLSSLIVAGIGLYLLIYPRMFQQLGGLYAPFSAIADEWIWGLVYGMAGLFGFAVTLWCETPSFVIRLFARMSVAFCLLCVAMNYLLYNPPPLSTVTYLVLSVAALWGIARTKSSGR